MKHIKELDSLRGIASIIVMISHYSVLYPLFREKVHHTPLDLFFSASASVSLFFVLSGFVLSISFFNNKKQITYKQFILKRFYRLYIPYIASVFLAMISYTVLSTNGIAELNSWFNSCWTTPISIENFLNHLFFIDSFENGIYNPVYWSLVVEMRMSIIFFILIYTATHFNVFKNLVIWGGISFIILFLNKKLNISSDYITTFNFIQNFMVGILLYKNIDYINILYSKLNIFNINHTFTFYSFTSISSAILIVYALNSKIFSKFLLFTPLRFLGKISYSLYLVHAIVLFSLTYLLYGVIDNYKIAFFGFLLSVVCATIFYNFVEKYSVYLSRNVMK